MDASLVMLLPISHKKNKRFIYSESIQIYCILEGLAFIDDEEKKRIISNYGLSNSLTDNDLIPYLFLSDPSGFHKYLTGNYNIVVYNKNEKELVLFNDMSWPSATIYI